MDWTLEKACRRNLWLSQHAVTPYHISCFIKTLEIVPQENHISYTRMAKKVVLHNFKYVLVLKIKIFIHRFINKRLGWRGYGSGRGGESYAHLYFHCSKMEWVTSLDMKVAFKRSQGHLQRTFPEIMLWNEDVP